MLNIILVILSLVIVVFWRKLFKNPNSKNSLLNKLTPIEFVEKYTSNSFYIPCADLKLYGERLSKVFDNWHSFEKSIWIVEKDTLEIHFQENVILRITNPSVIEEWSDKIVIRSADRINWDWNIVGEFETEYGPYSFEILNSKNILEVKDRRGLIGGHLKAKSNEQPAVELIG